MKHTLEISGMRLLFGERLILSDVYLKIETGDAIGLLGRNGAGKSCLMRGAYGTLKCEKSVIADDTSVYEAYKQPGLMRYLPQHHFYSETTYIETDFSRFRCRFYPFFRTFSGISTSGKFKNRPSFRRNVSAGGNVCYHQIRCEIRAAR